MTVIQVPSGFEFRDEGVPYLELYLGFTVAVYLLNTYLDVRQLRVSNVGLRDGEVSRGALEGVPSPARGVSLDRHAGLSTCGLLPCPPGFHAF